MFTIATTNMILRGDGKSNLINEDFLKQDTNKLQLKQATVGMMNPPYSQGSKQNPDLYELAFTEHLLDSLSIGARGIIIVPQSSMTGKTKEEQEIFEVSAHIGLIETEQAKDKKQHLLDVWFNRIESETKFCVETTVESTDEWLHSYFYFNDEIPTYEDFEKTIADYLSFEFSMIMQNREYLFKSCCDEEGE